MRTAVCLLAVTVLSACSMFATEGPARPPGPTKCNLQDSPVVVDAAVAIAAALASTVSSLERGGSVDVFAPAAVSGVFALSTVYGFVQVHRCRDAHEQRPQWSLADMPAVM
jgi:hypothetical protein